MVSDRDEVLAAGHLFDSPPRPDLVDAFLARPGHHMLVAYDVDAPVGFVTGIEISHPDKKTEMLVYELGTGESHRRQGVATALLAALHEVAESIGCRGGWVVTEPDNEAALATYTSFGTSRGGRSEATITVTWDV